MRPCAPGLSRLAPRVAAAAFLPLVAWLFVAADVGAFAAAQEKQDKKAKANPSVNDPRAFQGYTLISPLKSNTTYLIDMQGKVVRKWKTDCTPAHAAYVLENGNLLRPGALGGPGGPKGKNNFAGAGAGGRVQEFTWDGELVWDYRLSNDKQLPHHDITRLPNGNILMIVWDRKIKQEAIDAGRRPDLIGEYLLPDSILEVQKTGKTTGKVVWEWHLWDHLIQDHDKAKANYGDVAEHPERVDINFLGNVMDVMVKSKDSADKLKSIGYVGSPKAQKQRVNPDWTHTNCVAYNADLDQIVLSIHEFSEIWIIDHSTTTAEAAAHKGGKSGKGGDLLYRWGNPRAYRAGTHKDQKLFAQHHAHWIPKGHPGEGHLLVFNNGSRRPDGNYSSVDELVLPVDAQGRYAYKPGTAYGPEKAVWSYTAPKKTDFFAFFISGAQRLPNGNTLVCSGPDGTLFEVTPEKETVWKYVNPTKGGKGPGGFGFPPKDGKGKKDKLGLPGFGPPSEGFQVLPPFLADMLKLSDEQKKQLAAFQKEAGGKLDGILTDEQKKQLKGGGKGFGPPPQPGQLLTPFQQAQLKLTADQKKQVETLQKDIDATLDKALQDEQKKRLKEIRAEMGRGGFPGFGPGGPGGFGGPPIFGGPGAASLFRVHRYAPNYAGLAGRDLTPGRTIEEMERKEPKEK
jgi:hypothetical protein